MSRQTSVRVRIRDKDPLNVGVRAQDPRERKKGEVNVCGVRSTPRISVRIEGVKSFIEIKSLEEREET